MLAGYVPCRTCKPNNSNTELIAKAWQDRTIIGTAVPKITDEFHSLNDVGWYASSYMMMGCAAQLICGRIYKFYSTKWVSISSESTEGC